MTRAVITVPLRRRHRLRVRRYDFAFEHGGHNWRARKLALEIDELSLAPNAKRFPTGSNNGFTTLWGQIGRLLRGARMYLGNG